MKDKVFQLRVDQAFLDSVDEWRLSLTIPPSRASAIRYLVRAGLDVVTSLGVDESDPTLDD